MQKAKLTRFTKKTDEIYEFVFANGNAFQRNFSEFDSEVFSKLRPNLEVFVQIIRGEIITGLFIPEVGWLFKMTSQDLADYAKSLATHENQRVSQAKKKLTDFISDKISEFFQSSESIHCESLSGGVLVLDGDLEPEELAKHLVKTLEEAK